MVSRVCGKRCLNWRCLKWSREVGRKSRAPYCTQQNLTVHAMHVQVASMMPSDEAEAPLEYQKGSIGAIADRYMHSSTLYRKWLFWADRRLLRQGAFQRRS